MTGPVPPESRDYRLIEPAPKSLADADPTPARGSTAPEPASGADSPTAKPTGAKPRNRKRHRNLDTVPTSPTGTDGNRPRSSETPPSEHPNEPLTGVYEAVSPSEPASDTGQHGARSSRDNRTDRASGLPKFVVEGVASAFRHIQYPTKRAYLTAYALTGRHGRACAIAGIDPSLPFTRFWREDAEFVEGKQVAEMCAAAILEDEARRRAVEGVEKPTGWYQGVPGAVVREYSDILLMQQLNGAMPDKYKQRMEMRGTVANVDVTKLSDEQLARFVAGEPILQVLGAAAAAALAARRIESGAQSQPVEAEAAEGGEQLERGAGNDEERGA